MLHLSVERLAALADGEPTASESEHLRDCALCAQEVGAYRGLLAAARDERARITPPLNSWASLAEALRDHGVLAASPGTGRQRGRSWVRAAAAIALLAGGVAIGRASATPGAIADRLAAGAGAAGDSAPVFTSRDEALAALSRASVVYQQASAYLVNDDSVARIQDTDAYRTRLATLDEVAAATQRALNEMPYDPVINRYYLATMGARQATLEQLETAMPVNVRLTGF